MPDVTSELHAETPLPLKWVGMENIGMPISLNMKDETLQTMTANANVYVSLDSVNAKGIHMSRLHKVLNEFQTLECNKVNIESLLDIIIESQEGIGNNARLEISSDILLKKPALLSDEYGYQSYPATLSVEKVADKVNSEITLTIPYSSTCPCSASLSRQLYAEAIDQKFSDDSIDKSELLAWVQSQAGSIATPHSQRSYAYIKMSLGDNEWPDLSSLIVDFEKIIGTPVQTAVKRQDEQAFAKLNAENLMFCEDAARRLKEGLMQKRFVNHYWFKVEHQESLHAHNAVVVDEGKNQ